MRIHSVVIDNFRAIEHLEMDDLPETGVIIIEGPNEAGKSTILDAINLVLRWPAKSKRQEVKACAPAGRDEGPEVALTATVGETTFRIRKRWLKKPVSELSVTAPTRAQYTGEEAEAQLEAILSANLDRELAELLFLRQGELEAGAQAAGVSSISAALQAASGAEAVGEEDTELMAAVEKEYTRYFQPKTGKPKADYQALFAAVDAAREAAEGARQQVGALAGYVDEHARRQDEIRRVDDELPGAEEEAASRVREAGEAAQLREKAQQAGQQLAQARVDFERAESDLEAREALVARVAAAEREAARLRAEAEQAREARDAEQAKVAQLSLERDAAKQTLAEAREHAKAAAKALELVHARRQLRERDELLSRVEEADAAYTALVESTPARVVTDADINALDAAESELKLQRTLRDTAAAKLDITADHGTITVDGTPLDIIGTTVVNVFEGTELQLGDFHVVYRAARGATDPHEVVERAERALHELLEAAGSETVAEARAARDAHKDHAAELAAATRRREDLLAGSDLATLRAQRTALAQRVEELTAHTPEELSLDDESVAAKASADGDTAVAQAETAVDAAEAALKPYAERPAHAALVALETKAEAKAHELDAVRAERAAAEKKQPTEVLTQLLETARAAVQEAKAVADSLAAEAAAANPDIAEQLARGAENRVSTLRERRTQAQNRLIELGGRIEMAEGAAERLDRAEAELEKAESDLERATRRADAARLLRETMVSHRDAARARYTAPFNDAVRKHASVIFGPTVDFNFGDQLEVTARTVDGVTVPLTDLSGGTKEQLALLTRFAIADLVTGSGETAPVPVVVDDALGATDPDRLGLMNVLFEQVGQKAQVLVLTCFPQRFDRVNAAKRLSMDELKLRSAGSA